MRCLHRSPVRQLAPFLSHPFYLSGERIRSASLKIPPRFRRHIFLSNRTAISKPGRSWDKLPTSTGATAGFLNRQQYHALRHLPTLVVWIRETYNIEILFLLRNSHWMPLQGYINVYIWLYLYSYIHIYNMFIFFHDVACIYMYIYTESWGYGRELHNPRYVYHT